MPIDYNPEFEQWKAQNASNLEQYRARYLSSIESMNAAIQFATLTIRSLIIVNGGAVVVLMALLGSLWNADGEKAAMLAKALVYPFTYFVIGLCAGLITGALAYLAQILFTELEEAITRGKWGGLSRILAIITGVASIVFFSLGAFQALKAFS